MEMLQTLPTDTTIIESDDDSDNDSEILGTSGLINLGNTCYMNSIIQCLSNCDEFRTFIIGDNLISNLINNETEYNLADQLINNSLSFHLRKIFINIWNSSFYSFRPISFRKLFGKKIEVFQNSNQHDSQEALLCILDTINDELSIDSNIVPKYKNLNFDCLEHLYKNEDDNIDSILSIIKSNKQDYLNYKSYKDFKSAHKKFSIINHLFEGRTISQLKCSITNGIKTNFESFFYFTLSIPNNGTELSSSDDNEYLTDSSQSDSEKQTDENSKTSDKSENDDEDDNDDDEEEEEEEDNDDDEDDEDDDNDDNDKKLNESNNGDDSSDDDSSDDDSSDDESSDDKPYNIDRIKMLLGNQKEDHKFNLYNLLDNYIEPEYLDGENKWNSPYAKKLVDAEKLNLIWETPKILIFLIKRFEYSYTGAKKLNNVINFPIDNLDISKYLHPNHVSKYTNYSLFAINNHTNFNNFGFNGISFGHYYSYCKNYTDNKWYKYDDENVTEINESKIITNSAYMLFYKAIQ